MNFLKDKFFFLFLILVIIFFMQGIINIPVLDRDEARFATATKTMLETKDFIDIKMQEETRYKKPIGIYWAQVFSNYIFGDSPYDKIWVYRIPSLLVKPPVTRSLVSKSTKETDAYSMGFDVEESIITPCKTPIAGIAGLFL